MGRKNSIEEQYIKRRHLKAFMESIPYYLCHIFPIKENKIVMWTFEGSGGYACSPKYIAEEMLRRNREKGTNYQIYWLLQDINKEVPFEIKKVKDSLWARAYHLSTAKFWVGNTRTFYGTIKRLGTVYFQTWHGSISLKPIGKFRGNKFSKIAYLISKYDSELIDYALSGSRWCTEMWPDGLVYDGKILETGTPRCDILFNGVRKMHVKFREEYGIPQNVKICLYAPTFRGGSQNTVRNINAETVTLDFGRLIHTLEKKFGGTWYVFLRLHPQLAVQIDEFPILKKTEQLIDVSQYPDMSEIMASTDAIITDYSTIIFEGFLTGQPGFIYIDDLEDYISDRGELMFDLEEIPFPVAQTNDDLMKNILSFNEDKYKDTSEKFKKKVGLYEDGYASKRVVDIIEQLW